MTTTLSEAAPATHVVMLAPDELTVGAFIGCRRHIECIRADSPDRNFPDRDNVRWATHIEGACAEYAVCKALGIAWRALEGPRASGDIGIKIQVRSTRYPDGELIVRAGDADDHRYVFVTCHAPEYRIRGWLLGAEAKTPAYQRTNDLDPRPFYSVPQGDLHEFRPNERRYP